jgi:arabinan endo-1,5-alpha-L-arabinosidase
MVSSNPFRRTLPRLATLAMVTLAVATLGLSSCSSGTSSAVPAGNLGAASTPLSYYSLTGDVDLIHDPAIIRQGSTYYVLSTDGGQAGGNLPIFCSSDKVAWKRCGQVFTSIPTSITSMAGFSGVTSLWAPDVSYFNGLYHVYFTASVFGSKTSMIGLATSPTMNPTDQNYAWTYQGVVLQSGSGTPYNSIDSNIMLDTDTNGNLTHVWMTFGSFYGGIYQYEINPTTGKLSTTNTTLVQLATRPGVTNNPIEGPTLVKHNGYYYLFASFDYCCNSPYTSDNYKIAVGRGSSPQGPFLDQNGTPMLSGGGTIILAGSGEFIAPGGEDVIIDPTNGDLITFHALSTNQNGLDYLFVKSLTWPNDWPVIGIN